MKASARFTRFAKVAAISTATLVLALGTVSCSDTPDAGTAQDPQEVRVAWSPFESTALFWVALDQGYFEDNGLEVDTLKFDTGAASLDAALEGEADLAVGATEFPMVHRALQDQGLLTIASIARSEFVYVIARKDRGIAEPGDLRGKRIGTTEGTIANFYLGRFLELNGIALDEVELVDLKSPDEWSGAVIEGDVDAVATAQPYASEAKDALAGNGLWWSAQSHQPLYAQVVASDDWIAQHPEQAERFLRALAQAEDFTAAEPEAAKQILADQLEFDDSYVDQVWLQNRFGLSLDQSLVLAMEDEARWIIRSGLTSETTVPDFTENIYVDGLASVKPEAVSIIR